MYTVGLLLYVTMKKCMWECIHSCQTFGDKPVGRRTFGRHG